MNKKIKATTPYLYIVGWQFDDCDRDAYYVGMRHAVGCHPSEFWKKYFTSSERVKRFRAEHGEPNFIMILETFETCHDRETKDRIALKCSEQETAYLKAFTVCDDALYLNVSYGDGKFGTVDEIARVKMSKAKIGLLVGPKNPNWKRDFSAETRRKMSEAKIGGRATAETKKRMSEARKGKTHSPEARANMSAAQKAHAESGNKRVRVGKANNKFDPTIRVFWHPEHGKFEGTKLDIRKQFGLRHSNLSCLVSGISKTTKGWTYHGTLEEFQARNGPAPE